MGRGWRWTNCVVPPLLTPLDYVVDTPSVESDDEKGAPDNVEEQQTEDDRKQEEKTEEQNEGDQSGRMEVEKSGVASAPARKANESMSGADSEFSCGRLFFKLIVGIAFTDVSHPRPCRDEP